MSDLPPRPSDGLLRELLDALQSCASANEAASATLDTTLEVVLACVVDGAFSGEASAVRATLHLNDGQGFWAGFCRDLPGSPTGWELEGSRTAWEALRARPCALVLDVGARELRRSDGTVTVLPPERQRAGTMTRLRNQRVTHLLALPMRGPGGALRGMVTVELRAPRSAGQDVGLRDEALERLQALVDLGGMGMLLLPVARPVERAGRREGGEVMIALLSEAERMAGGREPLLIRGERGAGKSWLARWVHARSPVCRERLVELAADGLSAGELSAALAEEEGSLLLEDVERLPTPAQRVLVNALSAGELGPRLLVTCGTRLELLVEQGTLRRELVEILRGWALSVPPLSRRREEIPALAVHLLGELRGLPVDEAEALLAPEAAALLAGEDWPENLVGLRAGLSLAWREAERRRRRDGLEGAPRRIRQEDVRAALSQARLFALSSVIDQLRPGARALVVHAQAAAARGAPLKLSLLEGFSGLALAEALEQGLSVAEAADLFGLAHQREDGNHWKTLRSAATKLEQLCEALGEPPPRALVELAPRWRQAR